MPLCNRVDPFKQIKAVPQRGAWMGNRGRLHDNEGNVKWLHRSKHWIICELEYKDIKRELMHPASYTELFFLDECTALSAGHRPCNTCRRESAQQFLTLSGFRTLHDLDQQLHTERMNPDPPVPDWKALPTGTIISHASHAYLVKDAQLFLWSFDGYKLIDSDSQIEPVQMCTPKTTVKILKRGYRPHIAF